MDLESKKYQLFIEKNFKKKNSGKMKTPFL